MLTVLALADSILQHDMIGQNHFKTIALGDAHSKTALARTARGHWPQSELHGDGVQAFGESLGKMLPY